MRLKAKTIFIKENNKLNQFVILSSNITFKNLRKNRNEKNIPDKFLLKDGKST